MNRREIHLTGSILIGVLLQAGVLAGDAGTGGLPQCPAGLIEGPDPIPRTCTGDSKVTQSPELGNNQKTGDPYFLWGDAGDIAFSIWTDGRWSGTEYVASTSDDERDPRAFAAEDGTILVAWWTADRRPSAYYSVRDAETERWSAPVLVTDDGSRPSLARVAGQVLVVFERAGARGQVDLVAAREDESGRWTEQVVRQGAGPGGLDARVHHERGETWVEWQASPGQMAWSRWVGGRWTKPAAVSVAGPTWKAGKEARERIRGTVSRD